MSAASGARCWMRGSSRRWAISSGFTGEPPATITPRPQRGPAGRIGTTSGAIRDLLEGPIASRKGEWSMSISHLSALKSRHADLDAKIANEERPTAPDPALRAPWKKKKLKTQEERKNGG